MREAFYLRMSTDHIEPIVVQSTLAIEQKEGIKAEPDVAGTITLSKYANSLLL